MHNHRQGEDRDWAECLNEIRVSNGGSPYTSGLSGSQSGTQSFTVPMDAPSTLYYQCTIHGGMGNTMNIVS